jgi:hypothetical protein
MGVAGRSKLVKRSTWFWFKICLKWEISMFCVAPACVRRSLHWTRSLSDRHGTYLQMYFLLFIPILQYRQVTDGWSHLDSMAFPLPYWSRTLLPSLHNWTLCPSRWMAIVTTVITMITLWLGWFESEVLLIQTASNKELAFVSQSEGNLRSKSLEFARGMQLLENMSFETFSKISRTNHHNSRYVLFVESIQYDYEL